MNAPHRFASGTMAIGFAIVLLFALASSASAAGPDVHLVIKSWHLDFSSMRPSGPSWPCSIDIDSQMVVANEGTADYTGTYGDAYINERCGSTAQWSCGNQGWGGVVPIYNLAKGTSVTYTPTTTGQKAPFHVDCSPPSPSKTVKGGSFEAKWGSCRANIACDPAVAVATEDLLSVCPAAKQAGLLSACP